MSHLKKLFIVSATLVFSLACATLLGSPDDDYYEYETESYSTEDEYDWYESDEEEQQTYESLSCPVITNQIVDLNSQSYAEDESFDYGDEEAIEEENLVTYTIEDDELIDPYFYSSSSYYEDGDNTQLHEEVWNYFATLIPYEWRSHVTEFAIITDGEENILAAVQQTDYDPELWQLQVDVADINDYYYLSFTLLHEFAHLFTLSSDEVPPSLAIFNNPEDNEIYFDEISSCSTFHPGEGCSNYDSYINQFFERFWVDIYDEWNEINLEDEDAYYEKLDEFYYEYEDQFLTDYSVTHPAEDIAEAFAFFIFSAKPDNYSIADEKILFFYEYPELVQLRSEILNNLCLAFPE